MNKLSRKDIEVKDMAIEVLLYELKNVKKGLIQAGGLSSEKVVRGQLNAVYKSVVEAIEGVEEELKKQEESE